MKSSDLPKLHLHKSNHTKCLISFTTVRCYIVVQIWIIHWYFLCKFDSVIIVKVLSAILNATPDSKVHGANMGPNWGRQDTGGPHVGAMNLGIRDLLTDPVKMSFLHFTCFICHWHDLWRPSCMVDIQQHEVHFYAYLNLHMKYWITSCKILNSKYVKQKTNILM